jgi:hypothetical protein
VERADSTVSNGVSDPFPAAIAATLEWFETNSGWAPPDAETLAELAADGVGRAPDDCLTTPRGTCRHGLASWTLVLESME